MKILVKSRRWIENVLEKNNDFIINYNFISIFSHESSPLPDKDNILKLKFDDVTDCIDDERASEKYDLIYFNELHARQIHEFADTINQNKLLYVHCDAGISRSGAVGNSLNIYFNRFLDNNEEDFEWFKLYNRNIMPNPLVSRILNNELFGGY